MLQDNLGSSPFPTVMLTVTPPGADVLPWDESACAHLGPHAHSGTNGCKCDPGALDHWASTLSTRWRRLHEAAAIATRRAGHELRLEALAWEPQKRGAPHVHPVLRNAGPLSLGAITCYRDHLARLAASHGFGRVHDVIESVPAARAAHYLSGYFTTGGGGKLTLQEAVLDERLPHRLLYVSRRLTMATGCTMGRLRHVRHLWAVREGLCPPPAWDAVELARTVRLAGSWPRLAAAP